jgi:hypothetical protein
MIVSAYSLILVAHVLVAMATIGFMAIAQFALIRANGASTVREVGIWLRGSAAIERFLPLGSILLLLSGAYLTWARWGLGTGWAQVGAASLVLIMVAGGAITRPHMRALGVEVGQTPDGPVPEGIRARLTEPVLWITEHSKIGAVVGIVFLMEVKPPLGESVAAVVVAVILGAASAWPFLSRNASSRAQPVGALHEGGGGRAP